MSSLTKGGICDKVTSLAGNEKGRTGTSSPMITIPFSTILLAYTVRKNYNGTVRSRDGEPILMPHHLLLPSNNLPHSPPTPPLQRPENSNRYNKNYAGTEPRDRHSEEKEKVDKFHSQHSTRTHSTQLAHAHTRTALNLLTLTLAPEVCVCV